MKSILFCVMVWSAGGAVVAAANPVITSINGYSDGFAVVNGRYIGQLIAVPQGGTNRYKNYLAIDSFNYGSLAANPYYWDLQGANFGAAAGTVGLGVAPSPFTSISIVSWTPTTIRIKVVATPAFLSSAIAVTVKTATGAMTAPFNGNVVGTIKGRAAGQCTWFAAETRLQHGLSIPPTPWGSNGFIPAVGTLDTGYRPQLWDCTIYAGHIAIITSAPVQTTGADGSLKWTFTLSEYNAAWNESLSTSTREFALSKPMIVGKRLVMTGIGTNLNQTTAFGYFR